MLRARLLVLIAGALLTTSLGSRAPSPPPVSAERPAEHSDEAPGERSRETPGSLTERTSSATPRRGTPPAATSGAPPGPALDPADRERADRIVERLSIRHTALPARERRELARTIVAEARAHGLDPDLVVAVIEVESAGYHLAVSHVGAMGLMQLLPATGAELAGKLGIEWHGDDILFDPTVNVKLGTAYLRELADRYGDVNVALAAYNWGPGRIDRRLRRGATVPSRYIEQVRRAYDRNAARVSQRS